MTLKATIKTARGDIPLTLFAEQTPLTVASFVNLAKQGFYDNVTFHRVVPNFVIQGGCPEGSGRGGPGYRFEDEFDASLRHSKPGILSMANAGPGTNGSQFFVTHVATPHLDDRHSVFGEIEDDSVMAVVNAIEAGDSIDTIIIEGDSDALLEQMAERVSEWNEALKAAAE